MSITDSPVVELRQYTLKPGATDTLVEVFEAQFVESQEALGMAIGGLFHDRDDTERFVWMRGFASMDAPSRGAGGLLRRAGLEGSTARPPTRPWSTATTSCCCGRPTPPHPPARPDRGHRSAPNRPATSGSSSRPGCTNPATAPATGSPARSSPRLQKALEHRRRHLAHRTRREHLSRPARPRRPRLRLDGHVPLTTRRTPPRSPPWTGEPWWQHTMSELDRREVVAEPLRLRPTARSAHPPAG